MLCVTSFLLLVLFTVSKVESDLCCSNFTACSVHITYPSARRDDTVIDNYHGINVMFFGFIAAVVVLQIIDCHRTMTIMITRFSANSFSNEMSFLLDDSSEAFIF